MHLFDPVALRGLAAALSRIAFVFRSKCSTRCAQFGRPVDRWPWRAAAALGGTVAGVPPYWRALTKETASVFGELRAGQR